MIKRDQEGKWMDLLGVQEAVGSNPAVPTFRINHLRASERRPFCFADSFADSLKSGHSSRNHLQMKAVNTSAFHFGERQATKDAR